MHFKELSIFRPSLKFGRNVIIFKSSPHCLVYCMLKKSDMYCIIRNICYAGPRMSVIKIQVCIFFLHTLYIYYILYNFTP